jgi:DNA-binding MarR family transcriptional regulator
MDETTRALLDAVKELPKLGKKGGDDRIKGLTLAQLEVMMYLHGVGRCRMTDLASHFMVKTPTMTSMINKLTAKKFIVRETDALDRRVVWISIAPSTLKEINKETGKRDKLFVMIMNEFTHQEKVKILGVVNKFRKIMSGGEKK